MHLSRTHKDAQITIIKTSSLPQAVMDVPAPPSSDGSGKRTRKPKTFTGYLTETNEGYFEEGDRPNDEVAHTVYAQKEQPPPHSSTTLEQPQAKRRKSSTSSVASISTTKRQQQQTSPSAASPTGAAMPVKKVAGVQNATKKALEWLQYGDLSVLELTQSLPKLSKARVEIVMEALRAAGLVTLVRKHAPDASVRNWQGLVLVLLCCTRCIETCQPYQVHILCPGVPGI